MSLPRPLAGSAAFAVVAFLAVPGVASAHGLGAEARLKDGRVVVAGYFDDDTPAANARVWAEDASQTKVAEGQTDSRGTWSFPAPAPGRYRVTVDAGSGHRATVTVTIPEAAATKVDDVVSDGATREEFTRFPWERVALGLGLLALVGLGLPRLLRALRRQA